MWVQSLGQEDPWRRTWQPSPVLLPGESHGERSLAGYSPWGRTETGMTEGAEPTQSGGLLASICGEPSF